MGYIMYLCRYDDDLSVELCTCKSYADLIIFMVWYLLFFFFFKHITRIYKIYIGSCESVPCCHNEINRYKQCVITAHRRSPVKSVAFNSSGLLYRSERTIIVGEYYNNDIIGINILLYVKTILVSYGVDIIMGDGGEESCKKKKNRSTDVNIIVYDIELHNNNIIRFV